MQRTKEPEEALPIDETEIEPIADNSRDQRTSTDRGTPITIKHVNLAADIDRRTALITVGIGSVRIHGVAIWRSPRGKLSVYFPSFYFGSSRQEAIELPPDLRMEVESQILAAFRDAKKRQKAEEKAREKTLRKTESPNASD